jgi:hypothetical protein
MEPQYVCGAATYGLRRDTEITSEHETVCGQRQECTGGKKSKKNRQNGKAKGCNRLKFNV